MDTYLCKAKGGKVGDSICEDDLKNGLKPWEITYLSQEKKEVRSTYPCGTFWLLTILATMPKTPRWSIQTKVPRWLARLGWQSKTLETLKK